MSTILVVDDDKTFGRLLKTVFELEGHQVLIVPDKKLIVQKACEIKPALILMDVHIEDGDTLGVLKKIRSSEQLKSVPVVMTSGMDRSTECLSTGADRFIFKPFRPSELLEIVADLVSKNSP